jgi:flagellar hook-associated protein 2
MAGAVTFSGIGSGLDLSSLTEAILSERSRPLTQLQNKNADYAKRSDALKQLNARLLTLTSAADALKSRELGLGRQVTSTNLSTATATATTEAELTNVNLTVNRLATSLSQASRVYGAKSSAVLAGGATTATFELRKGGASAGTAITIDATNDSLTGLRDAINAADAGVRASIVDVDGSGSQYKLVLNSSGSGASGRVELVETSATGTGADLNLASLNPPGATSDFSALDASFSLNGLALTRASNTVSDAVAGMTITFKETGNATLNVIAKTADLSEKISAFVKAYNDAQDFISGQYNKDSQGRPSGVLAGDPTIRTIQRQLRDTVGANAVGNGGAFRNLTEIGVGRDQNGKLTLDATKLGEKLTNNFSDVQSLLAGQTDSHLGLAKQLYNSYDKLSDDVTGVVKAAIDGYQSSIKRTDRNIADQLVRLSALRNSLNRQFSAADVAIGQLNGQSTQLTNILEAMRPKSN